MAEKVVKKRAPRKTTAKSTTRKAPTKKVSEPVHAQRSYVPYIVLGVFVVIIGASIAVGYTDSGQINVETTIQNRKNAATTDEEREQLKNIPVQQSRTLVPDGGLVPTNLPPTPPPQPAPAPVETTTSTPESEPEVIADDSLESTNEEPEVPTETDAAVETPAEEATPTE